METPVAYIAGSAHGGSTLLDLLIGGHPRAFSLGEASYLRGRGSPRCSCGATAPADCPFWSAVDARLRAGGGPGLEALDLGARDPRTFADHNAALYGAVAAESGAELLVDSSKSPRRLERLLRAGLPLRPIHLVRSPFGVAFSYARRGGAVGKPARDYVREHRAIRASLRGRDHLRVSYERLAERPEEELRRVMDWLGLSFAASQMDWRAGERHNWGGNGMRFSSDGTIRPDLAWRQGLSAWQKLVIGLTTLPARRVF